MFLCCGDALFDLFVSEENHLGGISDTGVAMLGEVGGSPMNVAVGLARLQHGSRYFTKLSGDLFGRRIARFLDQNRVDRQLCVDTAQNSTLAIVELQPDGSAGYVFYTDNTADTTIQPDDLPARLPADVRVVHFASYSTAISPVADSLLALAQRQCDGRLISYDPNLRLSIEPDLDRWREMFDGFAATAGVIKASDEDITGLYGPGDAAQQRFVADCFNHGAKLTVITRGAAGLSAYQPDGRNASHPGASVDVIDTVGAGDTVMTVILHWLETHGHLQQDGALIGDIDLMSLTALASRAAGLTCSRRGADLPTLTELS